MGVLFFIAAGSIFILKQYGDMTHLRETYQRLTKIGLTKKEFIRLQASSQKRIYFTPLILGTLIYRASMERLKKSVFQEGYDFNH